MGLGGSTQGEEHHFHLPGTSTASYEVISSVAQGWRVLFEAAGVWTCFGGLGSEALGIGVAAVYVVLPTPTQTSSPLLGLRSTWSLTGQAPPAPLF